MLKLKDVQKEFKQGDTKIHAVNGVSFQVGDGEFVSVIGQSGSGKSTLLSLMGTLDMPTSGTIEVGGQDVTKISGPALNRYRCSKIGFVFQAYNLVPNLSALENVMLPMEFAHVNKTERLKRAKELLDQVGLEGEKQKRRPGRLSGGEQQRVAIARAISNQPALILADEPTGNLDSETGKKIFNLLHDLSRSENTTIAGKTDRAFKLQDGKLEA
jgi:putative ABC transport system ATP-binding protein